MPDTETRAQFASLGLNVAAVEARLTMMAGTPVMVVGAVPAFMGTSLILEVPATGRTFLLDAPEDDAAWPRPARWFRFHKAVPVPQLGSYRARR